MLQTVDSLPLSRVLRGLRVLRFRDLAIARERCPICAFAVQVRLRRDEIGVRCIGCGASAVSQSLVAVLRARVADLRRCDAYEPSTHGPVVRFLREHARTVAVSELIDGVPSGALSGGILCQDIQRLSFADHSFDLCTSTEVFEHVADDRAGFRETWRVLRPGGHLLFTVPLSGAAATVERSVMVDGRRVDLLPIERHFDRRHRRGVLCYRNYGDDVLDRLREVGFIDAELVRPAPTLFGHARVVVVARKPD